MNTKHALNIYHLQKFPFHLNFGKWPAELSTDTVSR